MIDRATIDFIFHFGILHRRFAFRLPIRNVVEPFPQQTIPPEFDLAFLDQTALQIYLNTDIVPGEAIDEITEHEATEMVQVLIATPEGDRPDKETWRNAHHAALIGEYARAKENGRLEKHHAWIFAYLEGLKQAFPDNDLLLQAIERQVQERTEVYEQIVARD